MKRTLVALAFGAVAMLSFGATQARADDSVNVSSSTSVSSNGSSVCASQSTDVNVNGSDTNRTDGTCAP